MKSIYSAPIAELIEVEMDDFLEKASFYNVDIDDPGTETPGSGGEEWGETKPTPGGGGEEIGGNLSKGGSIFDF